MDLTDEFRQWALDPARTSDELFTVDLDNQNHDEVFAFDRTRSRLEEMRSTAYLRKRWVGKDTTASVIDTILLPV